MMHIAIVGCGHGEIDRIYEVIEAIERKRGIRVQLLLCCGDFESVRNMTDLRCMACPVKYQAIHDFHRYYSGEKVAPVPTVFIGGNHEASNFLQELPYGGWAAPNIYFLGNAGVLRFGPIRIAGVSGIFKGRDYLKGRYECPPYDNDTMRTVYHYRNLDMFRLKQIKTPIDIMISHDWPRNIYNYGNINALLRRKPFFREDIEKDELGSRPLGELLFQLKPSYWFSAHLHVKFSAVVAHDAEPASQEPDLNVSESKVIPDAGNDVVLQPKVTRFLALDKVLPRRQFLQVIEVGDTETSEEDNKLSFDPEWLAVLRSTNHLLSTKRNNCFMPGPRGAANSRHDFTPSEEEIEDVCQLFDRKLKIPENFSQTAPPHQPGEQPKQAFPIANPQTIELCQKLGLTDPLEHLNGETKILGSSSHSYPNDSFRNDGRNRSITTAPVNPDEISLDSDEDDDESGPDLGNLTYQSFSSSPASSSFLGIRPDSAAGGSIRRKLELPPPSTAQESDEDEPVIGGQNAEELRLLESVLGNPAEEEEEAHPLFVIDTAGEPELKRRRNQALYKSMDE